jgi:hypothetical protein
MTRYIQNKSECSQVGRRWRIVEPRSKNQGFPWERKADRVAATGVGVPRSRLELATFRPFYYGTISPTAPRQRHAVLNRD